MIYQQHPLKILTLADLTWQNGLEYALEGIWKVKNHQTNIIYEIVGVGSMLEALSFAIHELSLENCCKIRSRRSLFYRPNVFLLPAVVPIINWTKYQRLSNIMWITTYVPQGIGKYSLIPRWNSTSIAVALKNIIEQGS